MRPVLLLIATLLTASTVSPTPAAPPTAENLAREASQPGKNCAGRIETVRQDGSAAKLQRDGAVADAPLMILAVDRRIDGCEVLVTGTRASDIRPLPEYQDGPGRMRPLR